MTPKEQLAAARRFAGKKSKAQGDYFEALIEAGCNFYRDRKVADIEKTPEPMRPIKDLGGGKFIAHYTKAAQADFKGFLFRGEAHGHRPDGAGPGDTGSGRAPGAGR